MCVATLLFIKPDESVFTCYLSVIKMQHALCIKCCKPYHKDSNNFVLAKWLKDTEDIHNKNGNKARKKNNTYTNSKYD